MPSRVAQNLDDSFLLARKKHEKIARKNKNRTACVHEKNAQYGNNRLTDVDGWVGRTSPVILVGTPSTRWICAAAVASRSTAIRSLWRGRQQLTCDNTTGPIHATLTRCLNRLIAKDTRRRAVEPLLDNTLRSAFVSWLRTTADDSYRVGRLKTRDLTSRDWTTRHHIARIDIALVQRCQVSRFQRPRTVAIVPGNWRFAAQCGGCVCWRVGFRHFKCACYVNLQDTFLVFVELILVYHSPTFLLFVRLPVAICS